ncbi:histone acetyltransferase ESA1 [Byssothecium circinans]|uniref:Histone acetyltransferase ESA1 n=1 Tax=Byssothecium circinans TaxID=147558 RepID=A0A6A5TF47_9PLEO|nr:histone acetyltransferase ESA1 [Byssothecium circinans]KAF1950840.1 histone acetyltransferase ESA1 [Byssothecium circinans]
MAPRETSHEPAGTPVPVETGFATLAQLRAGVKAFVDKDGEKRKAEILMIQTRAGKPKFYVHYEDFNKRLDEWIDATRIDLTREVEWPAPEKPEKKKTTTSSKTDKATPSSGTPRIDPKNPKRSRAQLEREVSSTPSEATSSNVPSKVQRKDSELLVTTEVTDGVTPKPEDEETDVVDIQDAAAAAKAIPDTLYSREDEIEKLRTSGSMTQNQTEIARVRNIEKVQMGQFEIEPWYFSPYPITFTDAEIIYICEFCLSYYASETQFTRHRSKCTLLHPPGNEIYRDDYVSFFEIDGRRQRTWCRNLCLLSKLFLDHKTLYYDVDPFLFYCMATRDEHGCHLVGYFSKEKDSAEGYNLACILTLPQYQRKGFGKLLIDFSYLLSKREGKLGSPEKPLSDLGLLGYRAYWQEVIVELLMDGRTEANVEDLGAATAMTTNDVLHTLQNLNMLRYTAKGQHVIVLTDAVVEQRERQRAKEKVKGKRAIEADRLSWKPPVFSAASRTWNW